MVAPAHFNFFGPARRACRAYGELRTRAVYLCIILILIGHYSKCCARRIVQQSFIGTVCKLSLFTNLFTVGAVFFGITTGLHE